MWLQAEGDVHALSHVFQYDLILHNLSSHVRIHTSRVLSRQVMIKIPGPAPCVVYGSQ